jgi:multifunctional methyltransferase subunit TRM112
MKLLTHNMLACTIKGVQNGFPLKIEAEEVVEREADFDPGAGRCCHWRRLGAVAA